MLALQFTYHDAGVGIVNAVEIVNAFSSLEQLKEFKHWADSPSDHLVDNAHSEQQDGELGRFLEIYYVIPKYFNTFYCFPI